MPKRKAISEAAETGGIREGLAKVMEAAALLSASPSTIYEMMNNGSLPFVRLPGRKGA
jgi:excisionase family DNA binding protein